MPVVHRRDPRVAERPHKRRAQRLVGDSCEHTGAKCRGRDQNRFLNRQLSLPVSTMSQ